nr:uncharacterized protein LOC108078272 isoform X2 [Drosophila kikkawai]
MSSVFEEYLEEIADDLYAPGDHDDYYKVLDSVKAIVKSNSLLNSICHPEFLTFGSAAHGIRMFDNDEYDVMIELEFPNYHQILVRPDQHRPGMVHLCFDQLESHSFVEDTLLDHRWYLKNEEIRNLMDSILRDIQDRVNCHTITATSADREIFIDFVPAIKVRFEGVDLQVVPKSVPGPKRSRKCTFIVSNIREELSMLSGGGRVMQDAVILLKALCESKGLPKIHFYHLVSLALWWLNDNEDSDEFSLEDLFIDLLYELCQALKDNSLSYYFYDELDLLSNFEPQQLARYTKVLDEAYMTLKTYPDQDRLSYGRCNWHFFW